MKYAMGHIDEQRGLPGPIINYDREVDVIRISH